MPSSDATERSFARALDRLKRRGSSLLVLGPPSPRLRRVASRRLLGDGTAETRRRVFVLTDGAAVEPTLGQGPATASTVRVVSPSAAMREASATDPRTTGPMGPASEPSTEPSATGPGTAGTPADDVEAATEAPLRTVSLDRPGALAQVVGEEIERVERRTDGSEPGELRLCVDSLDGLFAAHPPRTVRRFVAVVCNRVRADSGMAHCHLSADRSDPVSRRLEPAFDAVIELRRGPADEPEHRWSLRRPDVESGWLAL